MIVNKTCKCKLQTSQIERDILIETLNKFACACNDILKIARETKTFNQYRLHHKTYHLIKDRYKLQANLVVRAIARVAKKRRKRPKSFKANSIDLDMRTFNLIFKPKELIEKVSVSTIKGRLKFNLVLGNYQRMLLEGQRPKMATLVYQKNKKVFYIHFNLEKEVITPRGSNPVGIDLGINNLATTSNGLRFSGKKALHTKRHYQKLRASLQSKGTKSSKKRLRQLSGKEKRWMSDLNHCISKKIVESLGKNDYIVMENLTYIRKHAKTRKDYRYFLHSWAFAQLQFFIEYKALERGVRIEYIDPRYSSQVCSRCGQIGSRQGHNFSCSCGYHNNADFNASYNISRKGNALRDGLLSTSPDVVCVEDKGELSQLSPSIITIS